MEMQDPPNDGPNWRTGKCRNWTMTDQFARLENAGPEDLTIQFSYYKRRERMKKTLEIINSYYANCTVVQWCLVFHTLWRTIAVDRYLHVRHLAGALWRLCQPLSSTRRVVSETVLVTFIAYIHQLFLGLPFSGPAFSTHAIWSDIFQVLHFPALAVWSVLFRSCIFQHW